MCRISDYQQLLRPINRTIVSLKKARVSSKNQKKALFVKCIPVSLISDVKKLFNLIISFSLLYLVLCSIPHFHVAQSNWLSKMQKEFSMVDLYQGK